ncbi:heterokaryon incompatibility [Pochonia chlamydosporia 170]|uniref:Heterokaryon incompatibility n=1 Tax=Pochonia chlamydosporia 170 TaxID=1380566 RepID=A0A179F4X0_METCM|nr:heterokaryon incompatibility [Pochonia chlamydosporia 170]OAQ60465.1 heterokaryon incompatibility [Pochonia chlamydosporia 170]
MSSASTATAAQQAPGGPLEPYASRPLSISTDSIRVLTIEPDLSAEGHLVCSLQVLTFSQPQKYEALSYRWGDESVQKPIIVDGVQVTVTENLHAALQYLHGKSRGLPIWVDAISINQKDIPEKSRQLRIMPHIYSRAASVVVWLGPQYITTDTDVEENLQKTIQDVAGDEYWKRVWILQEIGKARKIRVCIGSGDALEWDRFVKHVEKHSDGDESGVGPLSLQAMRRNKYSGSCSLKKLLENHVDALCKDPRDKIYGLVGLAVDGRDFPIDYNKSLREVWADTVHFMSRKELLPSKNSEKAAFCKLLRDLLGGDKMEAVGGVVQFHHKPGNQSLYDHMRTEGRDEWASSSVELVTTCLGRIIAMGPSISEMRGSLDLTDKWEAELQRVYQNEYEDFLDAAHQEHDVLMQHLLDDEDGKLPKLTQTENYRIDFITTDSMHSLYSFSKYDPDESDDDERMSPEFEGSWNYHSTASDEPRLALVKESSPEAIPYKIAVVPPTARLADFICRVQGVPMKRIVIRHDHGSWTTQHVCGTAVMIKDLMGQTAAPGVKKGEIKRIEGIYTQVIRVEARTLYAMLFGDDDGMEELKDKLGALAV